MKKNNNSVCHVIFYFSLFFFSCSTVKESPYSGTICLSKATKKDREILVLFIDTIDIRKLRSLRNVSSFECGKGYKKLSVSSAIELLSQLDSVPQLTFRGIDSIPANLSKIKKLEVLSIFEANFEELPESIGQFEKLYRLSIGYSSNSFCKYHIKKLPNNFSQLQNLEYLRLKSPSITTFPDVLCDLKKLSYLDIRDTKIDFIPDCACNIRKIAANSDSLRQRLPCADRFNE